jgi:spermidine synthase/tetratricopeptide (TPR) repeat protein
LWTPGLRGAAEKAARSVWRWVPVAAALGAAAGALFLPAWDQRVMSSGTAVYAKKYLEASKVQTLNEILRGMEVLFYRDGRSGSVAITRSINNHVALRVNGKADASNAVDMPTQLMSGHLPLLLHPEPRQVLVIGMGSGITSGAVLRHPVERLDIVEIEPAVLEASRFFADLHGDVLKNPRTRAIVADGRNYLLTTSAKYDVIISEPSNPWIGGLASLFSVEFFQLARQHLRPDGLMLQWLQGYNLYSDDFRMVLRTFRSVFPSVTVWAPLLGDFLLIGSLEPAPVDLLRMKARVEGNVGVQGDWARLHFVHWASPLTYFMLSDRDAARFAEGTALNTDERLPLEFTAPRALYAETGEANLELLQSYRTELIPPLTPESEPELQRPSLWYSMGVVQAERGEHAAARELFERALQLDPGFVPAKLGAASAQIRLGKPGIALSLAQSVLREQPQHSEALYVAGVAAEKLEQFQEAVVYLERVRAADPKGSLHHSFQYTLPLLQFNLGLAYARVQRYDEAEAAFREATSLSPYDGQAHSSLSRLLIEVGRFEEALAAADESIRRDPDFLWAHFNRAWALEKLGRKQEAAVGYQKVLKLNPALEDVRQRLQNLSG